MNSLRIVFMGTPDFSVPTLQALIDGPHEVVGVFCQPDKEKGRGKKVQMPPVKEVALRNDLPVYQPVSFQDEETRSILNNLKPDLIVVIAYGRILPKWVLELPKYGCINSHASILPLYRGAAPIHWAILEGQTETGVSIMQMNEGMDTGDVLKISRLSIKPQETTGEIFDRLAQLSGDIINDTINELVEGKLKPEKQDDGQATYTKKITKEMGYLDWSNEAVYIVNQIQALNPAPGCYSFINGNRLKIWRAQLGSVQDSTKSFGEIIAIDNQGFTVAANNGSVKITEVQPENKKHLSAHDYCHGYNIAIGIKFDERN